MTKRIYQQLLDKLHCATDYLQSIGNVLNELLGECDAADDIATWKRSKFVLFKNDVAPMRAAEEEKPAERRGESGILKFTDKEILQMPNYLKKLYEGGLIIPHFRKQRNGSFELRCQIKGARISATAKTKAEAKKRFLSKLLSHNFQKEGRNPLFEDYANEWLETAKKPYVKAPTYEDYVYTLNAFLYPVFGSRPIQTIGQIEVQKHLNVLSAKGKARTAKKLYQIFNAVFDYAVADGILDRSPMAKVKAPIYESTNGSALTREEEQALVERCIAAGTRTGQAVIFLLYTGVRRAELATVQLVYDGKFVEVISGKQRFGRKEKTRAIPISPRLRKLLPQIDLDSFKDLYPNRLARTLKEWLPNHHLHDLRHTFITRAQECGISREVVSVWAGHRADNTMTTTVYTHFSREFQLKEIEKFDY